ncbi:MAG TPA: NrsF family protein [Polyangiaceae bacterium]|nr:NrsF family protein [Polyangiaceae bacterium]
MNDDLIRQLVFDLKPVERLTSPAQRTAQFAVPVAALTLASTWLAGVRADLLLKLHEPAYVAETGILLALFMLGTFATFSSGVPGVRLRPAAWGLGLFASAWLFLAGIRCFVAPAAFGLTSGIACVHRTLLLGVVPTSVLFIMLRRSVPLAAGTSGALVMTSAGALAILGTRAVCGKDDGLHVLVWHVVPLALLVLLGSVLGRAWFRYASR